jgi:copper homeostasis protein
VGPNNKVLIEACVTSLEEALACEAAGADRVELCVDLTVGGLTPPIDLTHEVCEQLSIPVMAMIRPHAESFYVSPVTAHTMLRQIEQIASCNVAGLVLGVLDEDDHVNVALLQEIVLAADELPVTFHRAFDETPDLIKAAEKLIEAGVTRVLTGGGPQSAWDGRNQLKKLVTNYNNRLIILGGGSVRADHVANLIQATGLTEIHARAFAIPAIIAGTVPG